MCITLNNSVLSTGENVKYLGINIDPHLNFLTHIKSIEHKISCCIRIMYKLKPFFSKSALLKIRTLYNNPPLFSICLTSLGIYIVHTQTYMSKLCTLQNKAIKLICDGKKSDHVTPYYSKLA